MKAAIYARVSTEEQRERQTIQNQITEAQEYCAQHNLDIFDVYQDDGVPGTVPFAVREHGARLLADAGRGAFETVIVVKVDRLGRDTRVILNTVEDLKTIGVTTRSIHENIDPADPQGMFMLTVLGGMATLERETIIERSRVGTNRLAREGAWLGGIVPFGYRVQGHHQHARLVPAENPAGDALMTEAEVVRLIYRMLVDEGASTYQIADRLNALGIPPVYVRDDRQVTRGKRTAATAGIWRPARVGNIVRSTTYKGIHQYGKRSKKAREIIERPVPALVDEETWERAQQRLVRNRWLSDRNAKRQYLLRGLIKCGTCGLTYCGSASGSNGRAYYMCNGKKMARGLYGANGRRCPSPSIRTDIEETIWEDIESFLRNPGALLDKLASRSEHADEDRADADRERAVLERARAEKERQRDAVISLFRQGHITLQDLDRQLADITAEQRALDARKDALDRWAEATMQRELTLTSARDLLADIRTILEGPVAWQTKRQIVELLVEGVVVKPTDGARAPEVDVTYRFSSVADCTDRGSSRRPA